MLGLVGAFNFQRGPSEAWKERRTLEGGYSRITGKHAYSSLPRGPTRVKRSSKNSWLRRNRSRHSLKAEEEEEEEEQRKKVVLIVGILCRS